MGSGPRSGEEIGEPICLHDTEPAEDDIGVGLLAGCEDLEAGRHQNPDLARCVAAVGGQLTDRMRSSGQLGRTRSTLIDAMLRPLRLDSRAWRRAWAKNFAPPIGEPRTAIVTSAGTTPPVVQNSASIRKEAPDRGVEIIHAPAT